MIKVCKLLVIFLFLSLNCYGGVNLNGDADYIDVGDIDVSGSISITAWFNTDTLAEGSGDSFNYPIIRKGFDGTNVPYSIILAGGYGVGAGKLECGFYNGSWRLAQYAFSNLSTGTWYHVAFTYDGLVIRLYLDGLQVASTNYTGSVPTNNKNMLIGGYDNGGSLVSFFNGKISSVAIWDNDLLAAEVKVIADSKMKNMPSQIQVSNTNRDWFLDDFPDGTALDTTAGGYKDRSGNGNDGQGVDSDGDSLNIAETVLSYP